MLGLRILLNTEYQEVSTVFIEVGSQCEKCFCPWLISTLTCLLSFYFAVSLPNANINSVTWKNRNGEMGYNIHIQAPWWVLYRDLCQVGDSQIYISSFIL